MSDNDSMRARIQELELVLDHGRRQIAAFDLEGKLIYSNAPDRNMLGLGSPEELRGMSVEQYLHGHDWRTVNGTPVPMREMPIIRALEGNDVTDERLVLERSPNDRRYIVQSTIALMRNGEQEGAAVVTRDVTNIREVPDTNYTEQLENAVRRSRMIADIVMEINDNTSALNLDKMTTFAIERIAREFRADSGVLWLLDDDERLQLRATFNTDRAHLSPDGYPLESFIFAHESLESNRPLVVDGEDLQAPEAVVQCMGGAKSVLVIPLRIRGERVGIAYLCICDEYTLDQSDRLFASVWGRQCAQGIDVAMLFEQIEDANDLLVSVIDQMPQAVVLVDSNSGTVRIGNSQAAELFDREFVGPVPVQDLKMTDADGHPLRGAQHPLLRAILSRERITGEALYIPQQDGTAREVVANHVPLRDLRGNIVGGVSVLQNRSDFASMDRARDEFISVVAHELRNPLTSLRGNLQLLQRRVKKRVDDENSEDDLRRIDVAISEADRIGDLVTRVLDVSRAGLGRMDILPAQMDAAQLIREKCEVARARNPNREVECEVPASVMVEWDPDRIYQVLSNLSQNADRYAAGTKLEIKLMEMEGDWIRITIRDHGPGVPHKIRRRLFKQYYRFDEGGQDAVAVMADGSRGLGIGLYVSAWIVRQHGGRLRVDDAEGGGAVFTLDLPRVAAASAARTNAN